MEGKLIPRPEGRSEAGAGPTGIPADWRLIETPALPGARNMAIDLVLADTVRAGGPPALRFYRWWPPCLSLGRNQEARGHYDTAEAERRGIEFVRRPTGGRAVYHHHEITYSVVVGERDLGGPRETYRAVTRALTAGLRLLGVPAEIAERPGPALRPNTIPCFRERGDGAILANGRKLVGSAQLREAGVLLQHGSILLAADQSPAFELLKVRRAADEEPRVGALNEILSSQPDWMELVDMLATGFERVLGIRLSDSALDPEEMKRVMVYARKFRDPEWTWRA